MVKAAKSTVATLTALETHIAELQSQADVLRKARNLAVLEVFALMKSSDLTIGDLQKESKKTPGKRKYVKSGIAKGVSTRTFLPAATKEDAAPAKPTSSASVVKPKYRDPATGVTWAGRGGKPKWFQAGLDAGKSAEDFLISKPATKPASTKKLPRGAKLVTPVVPVAVAKAAKVVKKAVKAVKVVKKPAVKTQAKPAVTAVAKVVKAPAKKATKAPTKAVAKAPTKVAKKAPRAVTKPMTKRAAPLRVASAAQAPAPEIEAVAA